MLTQLTHWTNPQDFVVHVQGDNYAKALAGFCEGDGCDGQDGLCSGLKHDVN